MSTLTSTCVDAISLLHPKIINTSALKVMYPRSVSEPGAQADLVYGQYSVGFDDGPVAAISWLKTDCCFQFKRDPSALFLTVIYPYQKSLRVALRGICQDKRGPACKSCYSLSDPATVGACHRQIVGRVHNTAESSNSNLSI